MATALEFIPPRDALNTTKYNNYYHDFFLRVPRNVGTPEETVVDFEPVWSIPPDQFWRRMRNRLGKAIVSAQNMAKDEVYDTIPFIRNNGLVFIGLAIMMLSIICWCGSLLLRLRVD